MAEQNSAHLTWEEGLRFRATSGSGHTLVMDSVGKPGHQGPSPMEMLLMGVAGCTAIDVVAILKKMREKVTDVEVDVTGDRADDHPKRFTAVHLTYTVTGTGLTEDKVRRAVDLSHTTYCSASASLHTECAFRTTIVIREA